MDWLDCFVAACFCGCGRAGGCPDAVDGASVVDPVVCTVTTLLVAVAPSTSACHGAGGRREASLAVSPASAAALSILPCCCTAGCAKAFCIALAGKATRPSPARGDGACVVTLSGSSAASSVPLSVPLSVSLSLSSRNCSCTGDRASLAAPPVSFLAPRSRAAKGAGLSWRLPPAPFASLASPAGPCRSALIKRVAFSHCPPDGQRSAAPL